jgi:cell division protein FtsB
MIKDNGVIAELECLYNSVSQQSKKIELLFEQNQKLSEEVNFLKGIIKEVKSNEHKA